MPNKSIFFVSQLAIFSMKKKAGAQVLKRTVMHFLENGWRVWLLSPSESGAIEHENLTSINIKNILDFFPHSKYANPFVIPIWWLLFQIISMRFVAKFRKKGISVLYGIGPFGAFSVYYLRHLMNAKSVSRFLGSTLIYKMDKRLWKLIRWHQVIGLKKENDLIIMTNDGTQGMQLLDKLKVDRCKVRFWMNGVDKNRRLLDEKEISATREKIGLGLDNKVILVVSRLANWKRVDFMISFMPKIVNEIPDVMLVIAGDGPERGILERLVNRLNLGRNVTFLGAVPHEELVAYYELADLFISLYQYSNAGNPLFEAMLNGKCILTINNGGTSKFIKNGETGIVLEENELERIPERIIGLLKSEDERDQYGQEAKKYAHKHFWSWEERLNQELFEVEKLLN